MLLLQRRRLIAVTEPDETVRGWLAAYPLKIEPMDEAVVMASRTLPFAHGDPMDRFIAATAYLHGLPLATSDARLIDLPWLSTIS